jgi:RNA recognition motif-containing protein
LTNLVPDITEERLREELQKFGSIEEIKLLGRAGEQSFQAATLHFTSFLEAKRFQASSLDRSSLFLDSVQIILDPTG